MLHLYLGLHLESFAIGMASSLIITIAVFVLRWEIQMYKKLKKEKNLLR